MQTLFKCSTHASCPTHHLDVCDLICPEPIMLLHRKIRKIAHNDTVLVVATDPTTWRDVPKFCAFLGHDLMHQIQQEHRLYYFIRKQAKKL